MAIGWTEAKSTASSMLCLDKLDCGPHQPGVGRACTIFRHRFAIQTLLRWYRNGEDPKRRLPILSTYLGHAQVTDTYWYLTDTTELLGAAGKLLEKRWEARDAK
jgi:integrase